MEHIVTVVVREVLQHLLVVASRSDGKYQPILSLIMNLSGSVLVLVNVVRIVAFPAYIILEVVLRIAELILPQIGMQAFIDFPAKNRNDFVSWHHAYVVIISLNLLTSFIACTMPEFTGEFKLFSFFCEFVVSSINAVELRNVLLSSEGWSARSILVMQLLGIALLELACWDPWSFLLNSQNEAASSEDFAAFLYCVFGLGGGIMFWYAKCKDKFDTGKKLRAQAHPVHIDLTNSMKQYCGMFPKSFSEPEAPPVMEGTAGMRGVNAAFFVISMLGGTTGIPGVIACGHSCWETYKSGKVFLDGLREQVRRFVDDGQDQYLQILDSNAVNLFAILPDYQDYFINIVEFVVQFCILLFYLYLGFANEFISIYVMFPDSHKRLWGTLAIGIGAVCVLTRFFDLFHHDEAVPVKPKQNLICTASKQKILQVTQEGGELKLVANESGNENTIHSRFVRQGAGCFTIHPAGHEHLCLTLEQGSRLSISERVLGGNDRDKAQTWQRFKPSASTGFMKVIYEATTFLPEAIRFHLSVDESDYEGPYKVCNSLDLLLKTPDDSGEELFLDYSVEDL